MLNGNIYKLFKKYITNRSKNNCGGHLIMMVNIEIEDELLKRLQSKSEQKGITPNALLESFLDEMMKKIEFLKKEQYMH